MTMKMVGSGETQQRYNQLKDSVGALRSQIRSFHTPKSSPLTTTLLSTISAGNSSSYSLPTTPRLCTTGAANDVHESFSMQHLRLQFHVELQEKREEIKKLLAHQKGRAQQIENLENEHRTQRRKLEAHIDHHSDKICTLEAQLSNRISINQQELQAQAYAFAAKLQHCELDKCAQLDSLKVQLEATIASNKEKYQYELSQAQMAEVQSTKRAQEAEAAVYVLTKKMKDLEIEFEVLKHQIIDTQALIQQKDDECRMKVEELTTSHEDQLQELGRKKEMERVDVEREKEDLMKQHTFELQSYRMQKVKDMDCVAERVRAAMESKDASIALLKEELAKQHQQASALLDIS